MDKKKRLVISIKVKGEKYEVDEKRKGFDGKYGAIVEETEKKSLAPTKEKDVYTKEGCVTVAEKVVVEKIMLETDKKKWDTKGGDRQNELCITLAF